MRGTKAKKLRKIARYNVHNERKYVQNTEVKSYNKPIVCADIGYRMYKMLKRM